MPVPVAVLQTSSAADGADGAAPSAVDLDLAVRKESQPPPPPSDDDLRSWGAMSPAPEPANASPSGREASSGREERTAAGRGARALLRAERKLAAKKYIHPRAKNGLGY